jgi:hypothetical protein
MEEGWRSRLASGGFPRKIRRLSLRITVIRVASFSPINDDHHTDRTSAGYILALRSVNAESGHAIKSAS